MADNFTFTQGSGATGAADLIGGILFPRVKLISGDDGTNDGDISSANPFPVSLVGTKDVTMNSGVTVYQGSTPWNSLGTQTLAGAIPAGEAYIGLVTVGNKIDLKSNVTVSVPSGVTVYQGNQPWNSLGTFTSGSTIYAVVNTSAAGVGNSIVTVANPVTLSGNVTVQQGTTPWLSLGTFTSGTTIYAVVNTAATGVVNSIVTVANPVSIAANVTVQQGSTPWNSLGTVTIASTPTVYAIVNSSLITVDLGLAVLDTGENYIGLATVTTANTSRSILGNVTVSLPGGVTVYQGNQPWNSLGTMTLASSPTLYAVVNTEAAGVGNSMVTIYPRTDYIGLVSISGNVILNPTTTGGCSICRNIDVDESEDDVHGAAGQIYGYFISNTNATVARYVKFYNTTAANTSVGVNTPIMTIPLLAGQGANVAFPIGIPFSTALCIAATTGVADTDTGAPAANDIVANIFYK